MNNFTQCHVIWQENSLRSKTWSLVLAIHSVVTFQSFLCYLYWDHLSVLLVDDVFNLCDHWNFAFCYPSMKIYYILFGEKWVFSSHHVLMSQVLTLYFSSLRLISKGCQGWPGALYHRQGWVTECYRVLPTCNNHTVRAAGSPITTTVHQWCSPQIFNNDIEKYRTGKASQMILSQHGKKNTLYWSHNMQGKGRKAACFYLQYWVKARFWKTRCCMQQIESAIRIELKIVIIRSYQSNGSLACYYQQMFSTDSLLSIILFHVMQPGSSLCSFMLQIYILSCNASLKKTLKTSHN